MPPITTVEFPRPLDAVKRGQHWYLQAGGREVKLSNLPKVFWPQTGYTKGDLLGAYLNLAPYLLPYLRDRPLTLRRMPDGAEGAEFYEKQAPAHTPDWVPRAWIEGHGRKGATDFLMAQDEASLLYVANLGCIEMHPMHARQTSFDRPDYTFFDLDPFPPITFDVVKRVALMINTALEGLGLRGYPKISGATGIVVYVPLDGSHTYVEARAFAERICRILHRANPRDTTMDWDISKRGGKVFLDYAMVSEGRNIASVYSVRPSPTATVGLPVTWDELGTDVVPGDFTIASVWDRLARVGDLFEPMRLAGTPEGQNLTHAMADLGIDPAALSPAEAEPASPPEGALSEYKAKRSFAVTAEPAGGPVAPGSDRSFMIHKHHASRLHYDLRLERGGVLVSYAVPRGLPEEPNVRRLAVHVEDHPLEYGEFEGTIAKGEYGAGEARIYDSGTYEAVEWTDAKITIRLHGTRVEGEYHLVQTDGKQWLVFRSARDAPMPPPHDPPRIEPMLATGGSEPFDDDAWVFEPKWDGVRTLAYVSRGEVTLVSRRGRTVTEVYPELGRLGEMLSGRNGLIDGEIVAFADGRPSFERIQQRFTTAKPSTHLVETNPVEFLAFDLLWLDGESLMDRPMEERRADLERHLVPGNRVQHSPQIPAAGVAFFAAAEAQGLEGIVAKRLGSLYRPGQRTKDWRKIKVRRSLDCVILGWSPGRGGREGDIGSLLAGVYRDGTLTYAGHVGTGFTQRTLEALAEVLGPLATDEAPIPVPDGPEVDLAGVRWVRPDLVCEVEYLEFTSQGRMRAASFKGLRADKAPADCVVENGT